MESRKPGAYERLDPGLDAADAAADWASAFEEEPTHQEGGEPSARDAAEATSGTSHPVAGAAEVVAGEECVEELSTHPRTEPQAMSAAQPPIEADAQAAEASRCESAAAEQAGDPQAPEGAEEPAAVEPEPQAPVGVQEPVAAGQASPAPVGVREPAAVGAEPEAPEGLGEPAAVEAAETGEPRARHPQRRRTRLGRLLRRVTTTMGAAALVALVWYFASSAVVFSRPSPVDGPQPAGAEQLDDRVIIRKTHVPAATPRMGGANVPTNQALGGTQPAGVGRAPSGGASGTSPSLRSSPMPTPTPTRPGD